MQAMIQTLKIAHLKIESEEFTPEKLIKYLKIGKDVANYVALEQLKYVDV